MQRLCSPDRRNENLPDPQALQALREGKHKGSLVLTVGE